MAVPRYRGRHNGGFNALNRGSTPEGHPDMGHPDLGHPDRGHRDRRDRRDAGLAPRPKAPIASHSVRCRKSFGLGWAAPRIKRTMPGDGVALPRRADVPRHGMMKLCDDPRRTGGNLLLTQAAASTPAILHHGPVLGGETQADPGRRGVVPSVQIGIAAQGHVIGTQAAAVGGRYLSGAQHFDRRAHE